MTGVPGDPDTFYFGAVAGGVWKTTDGGATWRPLTDGTPISSVGAHRGRAFRSATSSMSAPARRRRAATSPTATASTSRSTAARPGPASGSQDTRQIGALIVDPHNPDIVLVAALGHAFGPNTERGVFRTTDGGKSWTKVLYKDERDRRDRRQLRPARLAKIVYAALWQARRQPWNFSSGGPGSGLYRSTDGGVTWTRLSGNGLPAGILGRIHVVGFRRGLAGASTP